MKKIGIIGTGLLLLIIVVLFALRSILNDTILGNHTAFLFSQIEEELVDKVKNIPLSAKNRDNWNEFSDQQYQILADSLRKNKSIDWNSCSLDENRILDGWKRKCIVECRKVPTPAIRFSSCGKDGISQTDDDIVLEIEIKAENSSVSSEANDKEKSR